MVDVVVTTCDKYLWCLRPFSYLFNKYWSDRQRVIVVGFTEPDFDLPGNFSFFSCDKPGYPAEKWVDGFKVFLDVYDQEYFVFFHEDYWLYRPVDLVGVQILTEFIQSDGNILRVDLTGDRLYAGGMQDIGSYGRFDIIEAPQSQYQMSHQTCIMRKSLYCRMLDLLPADQHSAWAVELEGTTIVNNFGKQMQVYGTRQWPVRYANALLKGKLDYNELPKISDEDYNTVWGMIPDTMKG